MHHGASSVQKPLPLVFSRPGKRRIPYREVPIFCSRPLHALGDTNIVPLSQRANLPVQYFRESRPFGESFGEQPKLIHLPDEPDQHLTGIVVGSRSKLRLPFDSEDFRYAEDHATVSESLLPNLLLCEDLRLA